MEGNLGERHMLVKERKVTLIIVYLWYYGVKKRLDLLLTVFPADPRDLLWLRLFVSEGRVSMGSRSEGEMCAAWDASSSIPCLSKKCWSVSQPPPTLTMTCRSRSNWNIKGENREEVSEKKSTSLHRKERQECKCVSKQRRKSTWNLVSQHLRKNMSVNTTQLDRKSLSDSIFRKVKKRENLNNTRHDMCAKRQLICRSGRSVNGVDREKKARELDQKSQRERNVNKR